MTTLPDRAGLGGFAPGLVSCPINSTPFARHGPEGCDENGPAAVPRLRDRSRMDSGMLRSPRPDRRPILITTKAGLLTGQDTEVTLARCTGFSF